MRDEGSVFARDAGEGEESGMAFTNLFDDWNIHSFSSIYSSQIDMSRRIIISYRNALSHAVAPRRRANLFYLSSSVFLGESI
jgi:hypothetical protein